MLLNKIVCERSQCDIRILEKVVILGRMKHCNTAGSTGETKNIKRTICIRS